MKKVLIFKGLRNMDLVLSLIYGLTIAWISQSHLSLWLGLFFYLTLRFFLKKRWVIFKKRLSFILVNVAVMVFFGYWIEMSYIVEMLGILSVGLGYHYFSKDFYELLKWIMNFTRIEEGLLTRDSVVINSQEVSKDVLFPLTVYEHEYSVKLLRFMDSKLFVEEIHLLEDAIKVYQIHH